VCLDCCDQPCQQTCGWNFDQKLNNLSKVSDLNSKKVKVVDGMEKNQLKSQTNNEAAKKNSKQNTGKISKMEINCHKKFAIGSYVHLLNEPDNTSERKKSDDEESDGLSEEQVIDDYYKSLHPNKPLKNKSKQENKQQQATVSMNSNTTESKNTNNKQQKSQKNQENKQLTSEPVDLDKIASKVNSTGKLKWKNSTKPITSTSKKCIFNVYSFSLFN
jgi:hypothetical protein